MIRVHLSEKKCDTTRIMLAYRKPSYSTLAQWVKESWDEVDCLLIRKAFKCCGISVEIDGSEDDLVFDYEGLTNANEENTEEMLVINDLDGEEYEECVVTSDNIWE